MPCVEAVLANSTIAILGWGSLIWEDNGEFDEHRDLVWLHDGPILNIEFSRISSKRDDGLTLVIDPKNGFPCQVKWCLSTRKKLNEAIEDLQSREETVRKHIHCTTRMPQCDEQQYVRSIRKWATTRNIGSVIWTGLPSKYEGEYSVVSAVRYLHKLVQQGKGFKAIEYIKRAPISVQTQLRTELENHTWFREFNIDVSA